jgi:hypothetical protein
MSYASVFFHYDHAKHAMQNTTKDKYDEEYRVYSLTITLEEKYVFFPLE